MLARAAQRPRPSCRLDGRAGGRPARRLPPAQRDIGGTRRDLRARAAFQPTRREHSATADTRGLVAPTSRADAAREHVLDGARRCARRELIGPQYGARGRAVAERAVGGIRARSRRRVQNATGAWRCRARRAPPSLAANRGDALEVRLRRPRHRGAALLVVRAWRRAAELLEQPERAVHRLGAIGGTSSLPRR